MGKTTISWTQETWNPVRGCSRISAGCQRCYAERMAARGLPGHKSPTTGEPFAVVTPSGPRWTGKVELIPHMLDVPLKRRKPTTYFVNSMSDLFHEDLSNEDIRRVFQVICECRGRHTFQILTKRADRLPEWFAWAKTVEPGWFNEKGVLDLWQTWIGVSVEDQPRADERIPLLLQTPAAVRFLSLEPLLGPVDLTSCGTKSHCPDCRNMLAPTAHGAIAPRVDWVIVGGESGPGARPCDVAWIRSIVEQCKAAGVPVFVKQLGANVTGYNPHGTWVQSRPPRPHFYDKKGGDMAEWPEDLRVRELPTTGEAVSR